MAPIEGPVAQLRQSHHGTVINTRLRMTFSPFIVWLFMKLESTSPAGESALIREYRTRTGPPHPRSAGYVR